MASSPGHSTPNYAVEHLATFSTSSPQQQQTTPRMALHRLFAMEKTSGFVSNLLLFIEIINYIKNNSVFLSNNYLSVFDN